MIKSYIPKPAEYILIYLKNSTFCLHSVFTCFIWISAQIAPISHSGINWLAYNLDGMCLLHGMNWMFHII